MFTHALRLLAYCAAENRRLWMLGIGFFAFNLLILPSFAADIVAVSQGTNVLDLKPWYSPDEALQCLNAYGPEGRRMYLWAEWTADFLYPPTYSLLFGGLLFRLGGGKWSLLAIFSWFFDWSENVFITLMLVMYPTFNPIVAQVAGFFTVAKWMGIFSVFMMVTVKLVEWGLRRWAGKTRIPTQTLAVMLTLALVALIVSMMLISGLDV
jgi:hypothetical protein